MISLGGLCNTRCYRAHHQIDQISQVLGATGWSLIQSNVCDVIDHEFPKPNPRVQEDGQQSTGGASKPDLFQNASRRIGQPLGSGRLTIVQLHPNLSPGPYLIFKIRAPSSAIGPSEILKVRVTRPIYRCQSMTSNAGTVLRTS